jgi:hypothetical protein
MSLIFMEDPDLADSLPDGDRAIAENLFRAAAITVFDARWEPPELDPQTSFGLLILDGLLGRRVCVGDAAAMELLSSGDILRPWDEPFQWERVPPNTEFRVLSTARIAILDDRITRLLGRWPELVVSFSGRLLRRARNAEYVMAVSHLRPRDAVRRPRPVRSYARTVGRDDRRAAALRDRRHAAAAPARAGDEVSWRRIHFGRQNPRLIDGRDRVGPISRNRAPISQYCARWTSWCVRWPSGCGSSSGCGSHCGWSSGRGSLTSRGCSNLSCGCGSWSGSSSAMCGAGSARNRRAGHEGLRPSPAP